LEFLAHPAPERHDVGARHRRLRPGGRGGSGRRRVRVDPFVVLLRPGAQRERHVHPISAQSLLQLRAGSLDRSAARGVGEQAPVVVGHDHVGAHRRPCVADRVLLGVAAEEAAQVAAGAGVRQLSAEAPVALVGIRGHGRENSRPCPEGASAARRRRPPGAIPWSEGMIEESEKPGAGESDFLAERRARRATESGEAALQRRAEAAEATVQTLESHVASLQQRLRDAEQERRRVAELLEAERAHGAERESELRRVKQREYAEQQLRVEAEDRVSGLERDGRERSEQLAQRVTAGESESGELARGIEELRRQLAEAEQSAAAERAGLRRAESELQTRVSQLERRAEQIERGLHAERGARERAERELAEVREGHRRMEGLLGEIRALVGRLAAMLGAMRRGPEAPPREPAMPPRDPGPLAPRRPAALAGQQRGMEMADALAAAVERLRARALSAPPLPEDPAEPPPPGGAVEAPAALLPPDPSAPEPGAAPPAAGAPRAPHAPAEPASSAPSAPVQEHEAPPAAEPTRQPPLVPQAQAPPPYEVPIPLPVPRAEETGPETDPAHPAARREHRHSR